MKVTIVGVGNILLQDEGVGVHTIQKLRERFDFPEDVAIIDGGTMGLDLLPFIEDTERLLLIDAIDLKKEPGTIGIIEGKEIPIVIKTKVSPHQIGLTDLFSVMRILEKGPEEITVIGIQPASIQTGADLSSEVKEGLEGLINAIIERLRQWGVTVKERYVSCRSL